MVGAMDALGDPGPARELLVAGLLRSPEVDLPAKNEVDDEVEYIGEQFRRLLGREPNPYELSVFVEAWHEDDAVGPRAILRAILGSREYQSR
jgi:hypothetical protein